MIDYLVVAILFLVIGFLIGYYVEKRNFPESIGRLNIDRSDTDGSRYFFLEIDGGKMDLIIPGKIISMKVTEKNYLDTHE